MKKRMKPLWPACLYSNSSPHSSTFHYHYHTTSPCWMCKLNKILVAFFFKRTFLSSPKFHLLSTHRLPKKILMNIWTTNSTVSFTLIFQTTHRIGYRFWVNFRLKLPNPWPHRTYLHSSTHPCTNIRTHTHHFQGGWNSMRFGKCAKTFNDAEGPSQSIDSRTFN